MKRATLFSLLFRSLLVPVGTAAAPASPPAPETAARAFSASGKVTLGASGPTAFESGHRRFGEARTADAEVAVSGELAIAPQLSLALGMSYRGMSFDVSDGSERVPLPDRLSSTTLDVVCTRQLSETWSVLVAMSPGWFWAERALSSQAFGVNAAVGGLYRHSPTLTLMAGLGYDSLAEGDRRVLPGFGLQWTVSEDWEIALGFPKTAITYTGLADWSGALVLEGNYGTYFVEEEPAGGGGARPALARSRLEYSDTRLGVAVQWRASPRVTLTGTVGWVIGRECDYAARGFKLKSTDGAAYGSLAFTATF